MINLFAGQNPFGVALALRMSLTAIEPYLLKAGYHLMWRTPMPLGSDYLDRFVAQKLLEKLSNTTYEKLMW